MSVTDADAALDACTDLRATITGNRTWTRLVDSFITITHNDDRGFGDDEIVDMVVQYVRGVNVATSVGSVFAVSADIATMLADAAATIPSYPITAADAPAPAGFVNFTGGLPIPDVNGRMVVVRAITWVTQQIERGNGPEDGFVGAVLSDPLDPRDDYHGTYMPGAELGDHMDRPGMRAATRWSPLSMIIWPHGQAFDAGPAGRQMGGAVLAALWRFVREPYVSADAVRASRPVVKRARRGDVDPASLRVVRLRRRASAPPDGHGGTANYSHRFVVSGHWRNQWYPKLGDHRPRYIAPYVKGSDDLPLVVRDTVFTVDR